MFPNDPKPTRNDSLRILTVSPEKYESKSKRKPPVVEYTTLCKIIYTYHTQHNLFKKDIILFGPPSLSNRKINMTASIGYKNLPP